MLTEITKEERLESYDILIAETQEHLADLKFGKKELENRTTFEETLQGEIFAAEAEAQKKIDKIMADLANTTGNKYRVLRISNTGNVVTGYVVNSDGFTTLEAQEENIKPFEPSGFQRDAIGQLLQYCANAGNWGSSAEMRNWIIKQVLA